MAPRIRIEDELANGKTILKLLDEDSSKNITAIHDISNGGLAVALSEMVMKGNIGCEIDLDSVITSDDLEESDLIYSESHGRYIVTVKADAVDEILNKINVPVAIIGEVKGTVLKLGDNEFTIDELNNSYHGVIEKYMA